MESTSNSGKNHLPDNLRRLRAKKNWSQEDLAENAKVHLNTIKDWERGLSQGTPKTRFKVAQALEVEPHELMSPIETPPGLSPFTDPNAFADLVAQKIQMAHGSEAIKDVRIQDLELSLKKARERINELEGATGIDRDQVSRLLTAFRAMPNDARESLLHLLESESSKALTSLSDRPDASAKPKRRLK